EVLGLDWVALAVLQGGHLLPPVGHRRLGPLEERPVLVRLQHREQGLQRLGGVADERHLGRDAVAGPHRVGLDLDDADLARRGPSRPTPPVVSGWSSGTAALPGSVFTIGLPSRSATASSSLRARSAPAPARSTILLPALRTAAARSRSPVRGRPGASTSTGAVDGVRAGATASQGLASASATWTSLGIVRCVTVRRDRAWRTARSTSVGIWTGTWIIASYSATSAKSFSRWTSCW